MFCFVNLNNVVAANILDELGATLVASFDKAIVVDRPKALQFEKHGGEIILDGISGGALQLRKGEYFAFDAKTVIKSDEGTIAFWVRPHWSFYDKRNILISHTFASLTWSDNRNGYFVVSDGWWEPDGAFNTYFVKNNQEYAHTATRILYRKGNWIHLACTWSINGTGLVKLYADGVLAAQSKVSVGPSVAPRKLYLGSDKGTPISKDRWADSDIDEVVVFERALNEKEILSVIKVQNPNSFVERHIRCEKILSQPYSPKRDKDGTILETRAIFDEGTGWTSKKGADRVIKNIKKAGFNVYVPCVWHGSGTRYPSAAFPAEKGSHFQEADPLEYLIAKAHASGIQVHPWFTVSLRDREFLTSYYGPGTPSGAFDLHRPEFQRFIVDLIADVVRRYKVDGINLDYVRTMGICRCSYCVSEYQKRYKRNMFEDLQRKGPRGGLEPHIQEWQDQTVETIVRGISKAVKKIKPDLVLSVDGHPIPDFLPPNVEGRQEIRWANAGLIDVIFSMDYTREPDFEKHELVRNELKEPAKAIMLLGNYDKTLIGKVIPRKAAMLTGFTSYVQRRWPGGVGIYLYSQLSEAQIGAFASGPFNQIAKPEW